MKRVISIAAALLLLGGGVANALTYTENWDSDPGAEFGGWTDDPGGGITNVAWVSEGGPDGSGHLTLWRGFPNGDSYPPYVCPSIDPAKSGTTGNINASYGETVSISLDIWIEDGNPPEEIGYSWWIYDSTGGLWYKNFFLPGEAPFIYGPTMLPGDANEDGSVDVSDLGILATYYGTTTGMAWENGDFTEDGAVDVSDLGILATNYGAVANGNTSDRFATVSTTFDTTWTDTEANDAGFFIFNSTSTSSWADLMTHVDMWNFGGRALNYKGGGPYTVHIDNFEMMSGTQPQAASVPEPNLISMLVAVVTACALLRRQA